MDNKKRKSIEGYILFMLNKRDYSEKELRDRLEKKEYYDFDTVNQVIDKFKELKYISDERCAETLVRYSHSGLYGANKIRQKAFTRGLNTDTINDECEKYDFYSSCLDYLSKKIKSNKDLEDYKKRQKIMNKLLSRGFSFDEVNFALSEIKK